MYSRNFPISSRRALFAVPAYRGKYVGMTRTHTMVGQLVKERRLELRMSPPELARVAGVDPKTIRALESGDRWPQDTSRAKIEAALEWEPGSLDEILNIDDADPVVSVAASEKVAEKYGNFPMRLPSKESQLSSDEFSNLFNSWAGLYVKSVQLESTYARARAISLSEARGELVATMSMATQAKDDRPWTPPWETYPNGLQPWSDRWWSVPGNRERFLYWTHGEVALHPEFRKLHPEYLQWPTKVPAADSDNPADYDLAAHPNMPIAADRLDSEFDQLGEENQDPEH